MGNCFVALWAVFHFWNFQHYTYLLIWLLHASTVEANEETSHSLRHVWTQHTTRVLLATDAPFRLYNTGQIMPVVKADEMHMFHTLKNSGNYTYHLL
jgi:hypothetical protein